MQGIRYKIGDFPYLLARFDAGETVTNLAKFYGVHRDTLSRHLRKAGRVTDDLVEVQHKLKTRYRRKNFGPLSQGSADIVHAIADNLDVEPAQVIAMAIREFGKKHGVYT